MRLELKYLETIVTIKEISYEIKSFFWSILLYQSITIEIIYGSTKLVL